MYNYARDQEYNPNHIAITVIVIWYVATVLVWLLVP